MTTHADDAEAVFRSGLNCCQAVVMAFAEEHGLGREDAKRLASAFGGGISGMGLTCGAVTGALFVIGLKHPRHDPGSAAASVKVAREFTRRFSAENSSIACRDLLGRDISTPEGMEAARAAGLFQTLCPALVRKAAEILDDLLTDAGAPGQAPQA
ncbi:MAG TPA: C-GCAxxG-C-C family protein [Phycisphaerae bacterium]|nr:C-GCAxxG-C-C family protein [Phycisphaerae bacterium]